MLTHRRGKVSLLPAGRDGGGRRPPPGQEKVRPRPPGDRPRKGVFHGPERLPHTLLVLNEGEPHMIVAVGAEPAARRYRDVHFLKQAFGECKGTHLAERFRDFGSQNMVALDGPPPSRYGSGPRQARHGVCGTCCRFHARSRPDRSSCRGRDLHGLEYAVIKITFDPGQRMDHLAVTDAEPDAPAGHGVAFGERVKSTPTSLAPGTSMKLGAL